MNVKTVLKTALLLFLFVSASVATITFVNASIIPNYAKTKTSSFTPDFTIVTPTGGDIIDDPTAPG